MRINSGVSRAFACTKLTMAARACVNTWLAKSFIVAGVEGGNVGSKVGFNVCEGVGGGVAFIVGAGVGGDVLQLWPLATRRNVALVAKTVPLDDDRLRRAW